MRWEETIRWIARVREMGIPARHVEALSLSPAGAAEALHAALDAIHPKVLERIAHRQCNPYERVTMVAASTVLTAPFEWLAILLGSGSEVVLKRPAQGLWPWQEWVAAAHELPLTLTTDKSCVQGADMVIAMGSDNTMHALERSLDPGTRFIGLGHRFSIAWLTDTRSPADPLIPSDFSTSCERLAADAALHDGRGCFSPSIVFTPLPLNAVLKKMAAAMNKAQQRWPIGQRFEVEGGHIRARSCLAQIIGSTVSGNGFSLHGLPSSHVVPQGLPRSLAVVSVKDIDEVERCLQPYKHALSTVGTDDQRSTKRWLAMGASRVCPLGRMQRPPLERIHDGLDWVRVVRREA